MQNLVLALLSAFSISLLANWLLIKQASNLGLIAHPGEHRTHSYATPLVGGLAMFIAILISAIFYLEWQIIQYVIYATVLIVLTGLFDDRYTLSSSLRFLMQGVAIFILIRFADMQLYDLGDLVGSGVVSLNKWSIAMTIFSAIGVINAINMSDGLDGLAASMVLLVLIALLWIGASDTIFICIIIGAICGFLIFNLRLKRNHASVFMGDAGSLMLGLILAMLLIHNAQGSDRLFPPVTALWLLALPLFDAVSVLILRPLRGKSPFAADHIHYHHLLTDHGIGANKALIILLCIQSVFILAGLLFLQLEVAEYVQFYLFLTLFVFYFILLVRRTS